MPWQELAEKPLFKPKSQAFLLSEPKPSMMVLSRQPQPATPRIAQNGGCPDSYYSKKQSDEGAALFAVRVNSPC